MVAVRVKCHPILRYIIGVFGLGNRKFAKLQTILVGARYMVHTTKLELEVPPPRRVDRGSQASALACTYKPKIPRQAHHWDV